MADHIHTPNDGRGTRKVFVDGREIECVVFADIKRGIVDFHRQPLKLNRWRKRVITRRIRGKVEVIACG